MCRDMLHMLFLRMGRGLLCARLWAAAEKSTKKAVYALLLPKGAGRAVLPEAGMIC